MKLEEAFKLYFNDKIKFDIFNSLSLNENINELSINNKIYYSVSDKLKAIQLFLSKFIFEAIEIRNDLVFSYRKNVNVIDCIKPHKLSNFIYRTDIENFFPSINRKLIEDIIKRKIYTISYIDGESVINNLPRILDIVTIDNKLPIGFPSSPAISNFVMYDIDCMIDTFAKKNNFIYTRYADDILLSSTIEMDKKSINNEISSILKEINNTSFNINYKKTKIITKKFERNIFGISISPIGTLSVSSKLKKELEIKIYYLINNRDKFIDFSGMDEKSAILSLAGKLSYILGVDPSYVKKLRKKYGNAIINKLIRNNDSF